MKLWVPALSVLLFASCTKEDLQSDLVQANRRGTAASVSSYISGWERYTSWNRTDSAGYSVFSRELSIPQVTAEVMKEGVVAIFAKASTSDASYRRFLTPIVLPFYFIPQSERSAGGYYWYPQIAPGSVKLSFRMGTVKSNDPELGGGASLSDFKFRVFVLTKYFLQSKGLDANTVRYHYTYDQIAAVVGENTGSN